MTEKKPWHGVLVATALPFNDDLSVDYDSFAEHVAWLAENGCDGVAPNGSLGEYQNLTEAERAQVVKTAVEAAPEGFAVMPGVSAYGAMEARHWAEQAAEAGADCVMLLPPNTYRANPEQVKHHFAEVAKAGLPIVGYNNPIDTKVDLIPSLIAEIHEAGHMVGVKEFSGDPRRIYEIRELALGQEMSGLEGWRYPYQSVLVDESTGDVMGMWKQIADATRPDGSHYEVHGFGGSWFRYGGDWQWSWQRDFFDFGNVSALFMEMIQDGALSAGMHKRIERATADRRPAGWYPLGSPPVALW